jgi:hypothetical protein
MTTKVDVIKAKQDKKKLGRKDLENLEAFTTKLFYDCM